MPILAAVLCTSAYLPFSPHSRHIPLLSSFLLTPLQTMMTGLGSRGSASGATWTSKTSTGISSSPSRLVHSDIFFVDTIFFFLLRYKGRGKKQKRIKKKQTPRSARTHTEIPYGGGGGGKGQSIAVCHPPISTQPPPPPSPSNYPRCQFVLACLHTILVKRSTPLPTKAHPEWRGWEVCVPSSQRGEKHTHAHTQPRAPASCYDYTPTHSPLYHPTLPHPTPITPPHPHQQHPFLSPAAPAAGESGVRDTTLAALPAPSSAFLGTRLATSSNTSATATLVFALVSM